MIALFWIGGCRTQGHHSDQLTAAPKARSDGDYRAALDHLGAQRDALVGREDLVHALGPQVVDGRGVGAHVRALALGLPRRVGAGVVQEVLADLGLLRPVVAALAPKATLHEIEGGDHSFAVLKKSGRSNEEALPEVLDTLAAWIDALA
jgi:hypothetical protein